MQWGCSPPVSVLKDAELAMVGYGGFLDPLLWKNEAHQVSEVKPQSNIF